MWWEVFLFTAALALQSSLLATLLLAGVAKAVDQQTFLRTLGGLGLGQTAAKVAAVGVVASELGLAALLVATPGSTAVAIAVALLLAGFTCVSIYAIATDKVVSCSCFGASFQTMGLETALRSGALALASCGLAVLEQARPVPSLAELVVPLSLAIAAAIAAGYYWRSWSRVGEPIGYR